MNSTTNSAGLTKQIALVMASIVVLAGVGLWLVPLHSTGRISSIVPLTAKGDPLNGHAMITVPGGEYWVGAEGDQDNPRRYVKMGGFRIADTETSNAQFARFVEATGYVTDAEKRGWGMSFTEGMLDWEWEQLKGADWRHPFGKGKPGAAELPSHPVTQISGADALAYCLWLGARLPTIEEWEVAARAGSTNLFPWGPEFDPQRANVWNGENHHKNTLEDGFRFTSPVRSFPANALGLYDVIGNVFEYCSGFSATRSYGETNNLISGRGGSWWCSAGTCNSFNLVTIGAMDIHGSLCNQGFRIVMPAEPSM